MLRARRTDKAESRPAPRAGADTATHAPVGGLEVFATPNAGAPPLGLPEPVAPRSAYAGSLAVNILALALPLVILQVYDRILPNQALPTLSLLMLGLVTVLVLDVALKTARAAVMGHEAMRFGIVANDIAMRRLMKAKDGAVLREPVSQLTARLQALQGVADFHGSPSRLFLIDLPFVTIFLAIMGLVGGVLVCIPILLFLIFAWLGLRRSNALRDVFEERSQQDNKKYDFVSEVLGGIHTVKALALEPAMQRRFERLQQTVAEITLKSINLGGAAQSAAALYGNVSQIAVVAFGALLVIDGKLSMGALACCTLLSGQILQPLLRGISVYSELQSVGLKREEAAPLFALADAPPATPLPVPLRGAIRFEAVSFGYGDGPAILTGIDLDLAPGAVIALEGDDGSGRSTLVRLLRGDLTPQTGRVTVDGLDVAGEWREALRREIACVGQMPVIFRGTMLENLTLFRTAEYREAARAAARLLGFEDDIHTLPDGYDSKLGEGVADDIPASFAQQISIARALVPGPAVLVLDEANTSLDRRAEARLIAALKVLKGRMTIILVTHRPSLRALADQRVLLAGGTARLVPAAAAAPDLAPPRAAGGAA